MIRRDVEILIHRADDECKLEVELFYQGRPIWAYWAILEPADFAFLPFRRGIDKDASDGFGMLLFEFCKSSADEYI